MRWLALLSLVSLAGCSVTIPEGRLTCDETTVCPPGWSCVSGLCYAPTTDVPIDGGTDAPILPDTPPPMDVPVVLPDTPDGGPPEEPVAIAAGYSHTCALTNLGRVFCWGDDRSGAVGDDGTADAAPRTRAVLVTGLEDVTIEAIGAGDDFTCALDEGDAVYCWGSDAYSRLGNAGVATLSAVPVRVALGDTVPVQLAVGGAHACVISDANLLLCWGQNLTNQLGPAATGVERAAPGEPFVGELFDAVSAGTAHSCARRTDGAVLCWGWNAELQLGTATDPTPAGSPVPVPVVEASLAIAMGLHTCVWSPAGASCFGWNKEGQLTSDTPRDGTAVPVPISLGGMAPDLLVGNDDWQLFGAIGGGHTCGLVGTTAWCWGGNGDGQLGDGTTRSRPEPMPLSGLSGVTALAAGLRHTCAIAAGRALCWGYNDRGQLGNGNQESTATPGLVLGDLPMRP